jgi:hypothetical protein
MAVYVWQPGPDVHGVCGSTAWWRGRCVATGAGSCGGAVSLAARTLQEPLLASAVAAMVGAWWRRRRAMISTSAARAVLPRREDGRCGRLRLIMLPLADWWRSGRRCCGYSPHDDRGWRYKTGWRSALKDLSVTVSQTAPANHADAFLVIIV